ncbi:hypothetical protein O1611_g7809 [Lasiodiplodia mahajangana]|uniref:Uncharacterized protein n=1 Tax=Lasiodiplodia mahajangana TaxID=1108764 RepID=A0ACC2JEP8_9PEZI|nr:hypothetical protein O1611_g7809 [Lasiodiplodia mahajangana]
MSEPGSVDPNESCIVNMYLQPDGCGDHDCYGLPTILSTKDEALTVISRLHPSAHVLFTVMHPRIYNQFGDEAARQEANKRQLEAAKDEIAIYRQVLEHLDKEAKKDPTQVAVRDSYIDRNAVRMDMLKYMIHIGERVVSAAAAQPSPAAQSQQSNGPPPPYTP